MLTNADYLSRPGFPERCREVRADLDAGLPMSLEEIADRLGMDFNDFAQHLAGEIFRQDRTIGGVLVCEFQEDTVQ